MIFSMPSFIREYAAKREKVISCLAQAQNGALRNFADALAPRHAIMMMLDTLSPAIDLSNAEEREVNE